MTVDELVELLGLDPHPEGGWYRETFRAQLDLDAPHGRRSASTAIYFLLPGGAFSAWHHVRSDEVWHFYRGAPLELHMLDGRGHRVQVLGSDLAAGQRPQAVVPAGTLQAARPVGGWALCGCTVAPGFSFRDFAMPSRAELLESYPGHAELVERFTRLEAP